ncbi:MAG: hypothetical protein GY913_10205 [Proteobacteria bacterium]|nr:hypothetical protein [Pseudomonadota bacterium]MCP4917284.1 hypothetical protein [Pseudomonadota bacterium]
MLPLVLMACVLNKEDSGGSMPYCEDVATDVALDDETPLGFTAQALVDRALTPSPFAETLAWESGSETGLTLTLGPAGTARFVESTAVYPEDGGPAIGVECFDRIELDVPMSFVTEDGRLDETWQVTLVALDAGSVTLQLPIEPLELTGSYDVTDDITEPDYDEVSMSLRAAFTSAGTAGELSCQASGEDDCEDGETCSAWSSQFDVGSWGGEG